MNNREIYKKAIEILDAELNFSCHAVEIAAYGHLSGSPSPEAEEWNDTLHQMIDKLNLPLAPYERLGPGSDLPLHRIRKFIYMTNDEQLQIRRNLLRHAASGRKDRMLKLLRKLT